MEAPQKPSLIHMVKEEKEQSKTNTNVSSRTCCTNCRIEEYKSIPDEACCGWITFLCWERLLKCSFISNCPDTPECCCIDCCFLGCCHKWHCESKNSRWYITCKCIGYTSMYDIFELKKKEHVDNCS